MSLEVLFACKCFYAGLTLTSLEAAVGDVAACEFREDRKEAKGDEDRSVLIELRYLRVKIAKFALQAEMKRCPFCAAHLLV